MAAVFNVLIPVALGAVLIVLLMGLFNLLRGGNANLSQVLMRWRVGLQFVAVVVVLVAVWLKGQTG